MSCLSIPQIGYCIVAISDLDFRHEIDPLVAHSILCNLVSQLQDDLDHETVRFVCPKDK